MIKWTKRYFGVWLLVAAATADRLFPLRLDASLQGPETWIAIGIAAAINAASYAVSYVVGRMTRPKPTEQPLQEVKQTTSQPGAPIARVYGQMACTGHVVYRGGMTQNTQQIQTGSGKRKQTSADRYWSCDWSAVGPVNFNNVRGVTRILFDDEVVLDVTPYIASLDGTTEGQMSAVGQASFLATSDNGYPDAGNNYTLGRDNGGSDRNGQIFVGNARRFKICLGRSNQTLADLPDWHNTYGYRGFVTAHWKDMDLRDYYNRLPQVTFEVLSYNDTVSEVVLEECRLSGVAAAQVDVTAFTPAVTASYVIASPQPAKSVLEGLNNYYHHALVEVDGKLKALPLPSSVYYAVPAEDVGASSAGIEEQQEPATKFAATIDQVGELPKRYEIAFLDPARNYEQATATYIGQAHSADGLVQINLPMGLTEVAARAIAADLYSRARIERIPVRLTLPPKYIQYHPGDTLRVTMPDGNIMDVRILRMNFAPGELVEVEGVRVAFADAAGLGSQYLGPPDDGTGGAGKLPLESVFVLSNCPQIIDDHDNFDGAYFGASPKVLPTDAYRPYTGAAVIRNGCGSDEAAKHYEVMGRITQPATIGKTVAGATGILADYTDFSSTDVDAVNFVTVSFPFGYGLDQIITIHNDAFTKTTTANLALLGKEIIQFRDVYTTDSGGSPLPAGQRRLGRIKRGVRDTRNRCASHVAEEPFMLLNSAVIRLPININEQGGSFNYKVLTDGQLESEINSPLTFTYDPDAGTTVLKSNQITP